MKIKHFILSLLVAMPLASCDFLEEYSQDQAYVTSWTDLDELLIGDCYMVVNVSKEFNYSSNYGMFLHLLADELDEYNSGPAVALDQKYYMFGYWTWQPRTGTQEDYSADYYKENSTWTRCYKYINVANNIIESAEKLPRGTDEEKQGYMKVKGEAHFLRAFYYFWLVNAYGQPYSPATAQTDLGVPVKTTSEVYDVKYERNTVAEVYAQIEEDIKTAEECLSECTIKKKSIYRADITAVYMLASRIYLFMQQWDKTVAYADKVMENHPGLKNLNDDDSYMMRKSNPENIFSMGGDDAAMMMQSGSKGMQINNKLYATYSPNDLRKTQWFWKYADFIGLKKRADYMYKASTPYEETDPEWYNYSYYWYCNGEESPISSLFWLRSSEAYLNKAEALAYQKKDEEALNVMHKFMESRYNPNSIDFDKVYTGDDLINFIRDERMREFLLEGHRWFDLRRYRVNTVLPSKISIQHVYTYYTERNTATIDKRHRFTLTEDDASWTLPIPHEVLVFNTGMPNNGNRSREYEEI